MKIMIKGIIKFFTTKLFFGKVFDSIRSNFLITSITLLILVSIFYVPYEYFNYLEFKERFPDDIFGVNFLLVRPVILILVFLFFIILTHQRIKKNDQDRKEKIKKREEREESDKIRRAKEIADTTLSKPGFLETVVSVFGGVLGAIAGASLGIAGKIAGVMIAVNGALILAPIGAVIGFLGFKSFSRKNKENKK